MSEYIKLSAAIEAAKHAWAKGLEPSQYIEALPAADVAPVVHGRWFYHDDGVITCSECGNAESIDSYYCRYCGAKMDGGADNA